MGGDSNHKGSAPNAQDGEGARLRTILDSMVEAVFVTDMDGRVTMTNRALDELVAKDVLGQRAKKVIKSKQLKRAVKGARKQGQATDFEVDGKINDRVHTFHAQVSPLPGDAGVVVVLHDVTRLKAADRIRRDFVANASHELRTPLTAVRGFAETLLTSAYRDPEAAARFAGLILKHTKRLQRLAEDLTLLSQAEVAEEEYEAEPTDVCQVAAACVSMLESFAREKAVGLRLEIPEEPLSATMSARALEHVLLNLIENAIKYSAPDGHVEVVVWSADDDVVVAVRDDGVGIPEAHQKRIFERFYRVDKGRSREDGGTGLGLSIARHLVNRMDGQLEVESQPDEGSTFRVRIPIAGPDPAEVNRFEDSPV